MSRDSKSAMADANARAADLCTEFVLQIKNNSELYGKLHKMVRDPKAAYQLVRMLVMFCYMEQCGLGDREVMKSLMISAKVVAYQHFLLNKNKYGLGKKKALVDQGGLGDRRRA